MRELSREEAKSIRNFDYIYDMGNVIFIGSKPKPVVLTKEDKRRAYFREYQRNRKKLIKCRLNKQKVTDGGNDE